MTAGKIQLSTKCFSQQQMATMMVDARHDHGAEEFVDHLVTPQTL
jgi:hypothetical protein